MVENRFSMYRNGKLKADRYSDAELGFDQVNVVGSRLEERQFIVVKVHFRVA